MNNLTSLFDPKSLAIVGISPKADKLGNILLKNILDGGWKGKIYGVNPKYSRIGSIKCFPSLGKIGQKIDLVLIAIPAPLVLEAIKSGIKSNPKINNYVVISSGFKETGAEGKKREEELEDLAKENNVNILGPNCLGFINPKIKLNASFTSGNFKPGKVAIISQSGALAVALLDWTQGMSIGFSKVISIGNKTDLDESDVLDYLAADKDTDIIALYLEDIKNGSKFLSSVSRIGSKKPVVILKAGRNAAGQKAISSHTGSLAQDEEIISAVFRKLNVIEADNITEFQDLLSYLNSNDIPKRKELIIVTNAGGPGVLASDFIGKSKNIKLIKFPPTLKNIFKKYLPGSASLENPIDIIGDAPPERYENVLETLSKKYSDNSILLILTPQSQTNPNKVTQIVNRHKKGFPALVTCFMGGIRVAKSLESLKKNGIANFESPERALTIIEKLYLYQINRKKFFTKSSEAGIKMNLGTNTLIHSVQKEKRKMLSWLETKEIFGKYGIRIASSISFKKLSNEILREISYPCALKTDDPKIIHRWDSNAVTLNLRDEKELKKAYLKMRRSTKSDQFLIQPMAKPGLELIIGLKRDISFGPVVVCGWGGTFTEIFKDSSLFIPPLTHREIEENLTNLKIYPILKGFRGEKGYDLTNIVKIILSFQSIALDNPGISEIDINPILIYNNGNKDQIIDAKVYLT
jgi:acetyl coenzyme A synthetase (ADP forming)-like protein